MKRDNGLFITFEGGEGAGKTTLLEEMSRVFSNRGLSVIKTREPGGTRLGEMIRTILLQKGDVAISSHAELCLFLASRAEHIAEVIVPALKKNQIVLCDRFNDSTIAYQGAARGLGVEAVEKVCEFISHGTLPDLTFYLDIDPRLGLQRAAGRNQHPDRIESEKLAFHQTIRDAYLRLHKQHPDRIRLLDATRPPSEVFAHAMKDVERCLMPI